MFKQQLLEILNNLPLILSDTQDTKDISLNRVVVVICLPFLLMSPLVTLCFFPEWFDRLKPMWTELLTFTGALLGANVIKKFTGSGQKPTP